MHRPAPRSSYARDASWVVALLVASACGAAAAPQPAAPRPVTSQGPAIDEPQHGSIVDAGACGPAFAEYELRWRVALTADLREVSDSLEPDAIEEIVASQVVTLPNHDELAKLRTVHGVVALFLADAPWPVAFAAADRAIDRCGEGARRPGPGGPARRSTGR